MIYETNCTGISIDKWNELMKGARPCSKNKAVKAAIETGVIDEQQGKQELKNKHYNPYQPMQTKTHIIYIHSAIEYFILK